MLGVLLLSDTVSEDAISGISGALPRWALLGIGAFGVISLWSSYIVIGMDVKDILAYDFRVPKIVSALFVFIAPMALFLAGFQSFLALVGVAGGVFFGAGGDFYSRDVEARRFSYLRSVAVFQKNAAGGALLPRGGFYFGNDL